MANIDEDETKSNVSDSSSKSNTNYENLLDAFKELHEKVQRLTFVNKTLKGQVRWHIEKFSTLQKEVHDLRKEKVDLEKSIEDSICTCKYNNIASSSYYENCKHLQCKIDYLEKPLAKFTSGRANLDALLSSQKYVMGRTRLRYGLERKQKAYKNFFNFSTPSTPPFILC